MPRLRYDQLMRFGWKVLLPVATLNAVMTAILVVAIGRSDAAAVLDNEGVRGHVRQIFRKPITQQYPEFKRAVYPRFRGRHMLHRHENGLEKCVGCSLCAAACPSDCIRVVAAENTAENRVSAGERYARIYEINLSRCIFCGYCDSRALRRDHTREPVRDLGVLARRPDLHEGHAADRADQARPEQDPDLYDTPDPRLHVVVVRREGGEGVGEYGQLHRLGDLGLRGARVRLGTALRGLA